MADNWFKALSNERPCGAIEDLLVSEKFSNNDSHRDYIATLAVRKVRGFCGTIDDAGDYYSEVYAGNASLADSITADYHGRFLIELIQNANDVHPETRFDGEIEIVFDKLSGEFGTLSIANRGSAFSEKNVNALCDMGLSSKPPGESIGNKGLGFRSVHHITDRPLIYSQLEGQVGLDRFEGYCFSFADEADLNGLIENSRHRALAQRDLPLFHVPTWLSEQPALVRDFARRGFASVISLPIRDSSAADTVRKEMDAIQSQGVPLLLFLTRLERLSLRIMESEPPSNVDFTLTRKERSLPVDDHHLSIVDLAESGTFLVARHQISEEAMRAAIKEGTDDKQLHKHWLKWEGAGELALAVKMDGEVTNPRLYTYLPMGEQAFAPFAGYLHGSFFPTSNRKGLDASIKLNELLLNEATTLASSTVALLSQKSLSELDESLDAATTACAVVDLLCWRKVASLETTRDLAAQVAQKVAARMGAPSFNEASVIPCLAPDRDATLLAWHSPTSARHWPFEAGTFSSKVAAEFSPETKIAPIWTRLGSRTDPLVSFLSQQATLYKASPSPLERSDLATRVASKLVETPSTKLIQWVAFYKDLIVLLDRSASALVGREILLCSDGKLRRTMSPAVEVEGKVRRRGRRDRAEAFVFAPPARRGTQQSDDEHLKPPESLSSNFAFLSDELDWYGELSAVRLFLENAKLVFPFDREIVLAQLSRAVRADGRNGILATGLRWAFQLWLQPREAGRAFKLQSQHRFLIPNLSGNFIEANEAVFSETWPAETQGQLLQKFLTTAPPDNEELRSLSDRRLARRSHYVFKGQKSNELWVQFLVELGVQRGLHPIPLKLPRPIPAHRLNNLSFCTELGISNEAARAWMAGIEEIYPGATHLPSSTDYVVRGDIWWMPGQGDVHRFSRECLEHYALLLIGWLGSARLPNWTIEVHHSHFTNSDSRQWATPVAAFLRAATWLPAEEPSSEGTRPITARPSNIWLASESGGERFPPFLRRPTIHVMRMLERSNPEQIKTLRDRSHLRVLNQIETLGEQASFLAEQYQREGFDKYFERHFLNLYYKTWILLADSMAVDESMAMKIATPKVLVVRRGGDFEFVEAVSASEDSNELIYVRDGNDETIESLVEASGKLLFDTRGANPVRIGKLMRKLYGQKIRLLSEVSYSMTGDGQPLGNGDMLAASLRCPRLRILVAISMEALKGADLQRLPADRFSVIARLDHLQVQIVHALTFHIDGVEVSQEIEDRRAFALKLPSNQDLVVIHTTGQLSWSILDDALGAICEAIEQPALQPYLSLLILGLSTSGKSVSESPAVDLELEFLFGLLRLNESSRRAVRETLGAQLERIVPWLRAILHMAGGETAVDAFATQETLALKDVSKLREAISPWLQIMSLDTDMVLETCKNALSTAELQERLGLNFELLNHSLVAVGEKPNTYAEFQAAQVANYVRENELSILDSLRNAYSKQLDRYEMAPGYRVSRESARKLGPKAQWLLRFKDVPPEEIVEHVSTWLISQGCQIDTAPSILQPLDEVRQRNAAAVSKFVKLAGPLVKAWCAKSNVGKPTLWTELDGGIAALREALDQGGIFDYKSLNSAEVLAWTVVVGAWPDSMPHSIDRQDLGIIDSDLNAEKAKAAEEVEARKRDARSILFNGVKVDPESLDWQSLANELAKTLSKRMLSTPLGASTHLLPAKPPAQRSPNSSSGGGSWNPPSPRPPSQKTELIGRIGELSVYQWLRERLPKQNIDAAWLSTNGFEFTGRPGSDGLGYDFAVSFRNQIWQIEVKASLGDPCSFDLGETEVRAGRAAARSRSGVQYWIAYVSNLSDAANAKVEMLPNPMSEEGEAVLNLLGEGLRYGFRRS